MNAQASAVAVPRDWRCVALDVTAMCSLPAGSPIKQVFDVCFYDATERTFCCEATPSFHLRGLYVSVVLHDWADPDSPSVCEARDALETSGVEDSYMHCSNVKDLPNVAFGEDAEEEDVREYWQGNCPF